MNNGRVLALFIGGLVLLAAAGLGLISLARQEYFVSSGLLAGFYLFGLAVSLYGLSGLRRRPNEVQATGRSPRIQKAPGTRLYVLVDFLFSPATVEGTFRPIIAGWRFECFEALKQNRKWKARWISLRYYYRFIMAMSFSRVVSLLKDFRSAIK